MSDCASPLMARMWSVAIKNDVDISCGFLGAPRSTRMVQTAIWRGARADLGSRIAKPQTRFESHVSRGSGFRVFVLAGLWEGTLEDQR